MENLIIPSLDPKTSFEISSKPKKLKVDETSLNEAAERFDETRGFKFISYAVWWIRQSVLQALAEHSRIVRLPLNRVGTISKINKASERLEQEFERVPRADELAHQLEMKVNEINDAQRIARRHHSLDTPFSDDEKNSLLDVISDSNTEDPDLELQMDSLEQEVKDALETLKDREKDIISKRRLSESPKTLEDLSIEYKIISSNVRDNIVFPFYINEAVSYTHLTLPTSDLV